MPSPIRLFAVNDVEIALSPVPPYSFPAALAYLASSPSSVLEAVDIERATYQRALKIDGVDLLLELRSSGSVGEPTLELRITGSPVTPELVEAARQRVETIFLANVDPAPFYEVAERDPILATVVRELPGVRPLLVADPYEALIFAIVGQQVNIAFARKMKLALIEQYGRRVQFGDREFLTLPEPERIASLDPAELRALQFSRQKSDYLIGLSRAITTGDLRLDELRDLPLEEAIARLTRHRGIGRWTAEYVLMRGLGSRDSLPVGDLGLRKIVGYAYGLGRTASETEVREIAEYWVGWRGWAAYLWWLELQRNGISRFAP